MNQSTYFYSRASREARPARAEHVSYRTQHFYSRASREARPEIENIEIIGYISTHAPLARRDRKRKSPRNFYLHFYSRASREARHDNSSIIGDHDVISTHAPLARRDWNLADDYADLPISTHAPLARRDPAQAQEVQALEYHFYSRASREARRKAIAAQVKASLHFYSRASREARLGRRRSRQPARAFLLTRLSRGATYSTHSHTAKAPFLLTRLSRGATTYVLGEGAISYISTHAPLARRDTTGTLVAPPLGHFYSRASREARPGYGSRCFISAKFLLTRLSRGATTVMSFVSPTDQFLLTRLSRGATLLVRSCLHGVLISTHAPLARRDVLPSSIPRDLPYFYSRASREARQAPEPITETAAPISTHAPLARRDSIAGAPQILLSLFLLTRLSRGATRTSQTSRAVSSTFLLTRLSRGATKTAPEQPVSCPISTHAPLARRDGKRYRHLF